MEKFVLNETQNVLNRMKKAYEKGYGIRISAEELKELSLTFIGEIWNEPDPRKKVKRRE